MKKIIYLILVVILCIAFSGCKPQPEDPVEKDLDTLKTIVNILGDELTNLGIEKQIADDVIMKIEEYNKEAKYVIAFDIKNETIAILNMTIHLPVEKAFFDSVEIGQNITESEIKSIQGAEHIDFSLDGWIITVHDKIERN
jgi:hypothetical protein